MIDHEFLDLSSPSIDAGLKDPRSPAELAVWCREVGQRLRSLRSRLEGDDGGHVANYEFKSVSRAVSLCRRFANESQIDLSAEFAFPEIDDDPEGVEAILAWADRLHPQARLNRHIRLLKDVEELLSKIIVAANDKAEKKRPLPELATAEQLAEYFGLKVNAMRNRLARLRKKYDSCYQEPAKDGIPCKGDSYLYRTSKVVPILDEALKKKHR
jgi:hypothetical protein